MWAYYGEGGEGICLELTFTPTIMEVSQLFLGSVIYSEQARVLNRAEDWDDFSGTRRAASRDAAPSNAPSHDLHAP